MIKADDIRQRNLNKVQNFKEAAHQTTFDRSSIDADVSENTRNSNNITKNHQDLRGLRPDPDDIDADHVPLKANTLTNSMAFSYNIAPKTIRAVQNLKMEDYESAFINNQNLQDAKNSRDSKNLQDKLVESMIILQNKANDKEKFKLNQNVSKAAVGYVNNSQSLQIIDSTNQSYNPYEEISMFEKNYMRD